MSIAEPIAVREAAPVSEKATDEAERLARFRLARSMNVGPRTYTHLLRRYGTAVRALDAVPHLAARGGRRNYVACPADQATAEIEAGDRAGARMILHGDADYPPLLAAIDSPPPVLWVAGNTRLFRRPAVAIVGARNASALGLRTARRLGRELGEAGRVVVSGLARGVDAAAHEASLETGTIAVFAGGLDHVYPAEHADLADRIAKGGAIVSECPMGSEPTARHFPRRNRLISGLAEGVVLIEAAIRSGSLITARYALDQGREAMACPGAPEDPRVGGCNALIRDGAALIRTVDDVIEALAAPRCRGMAEDGSDFLFDADSFGDEESRDDYDSLSDFDEDGGSGDLALSEQVMSLLSAHPVDQDELARLCGADPSDLSLAILELDLAGQITIMPGGQIARTAD